MNAFVIAFDYLCASVSAAAAFVLYRLCCTPRPTEAQRVAAANKRVGITRPGLAADEHDVGPDSLQLLATVDGHLDQYAALDDDLTGAFGTGAPIPDLTTHPDFVAGCDRLWQAIRDEQNKGD